MNTKLITLAALFVLSGCENRTPQWETDQRLRHTIFRECMNLLPAGPRSTRYNDWDEVVSECESVAFYQARVCIRNCEDIPNGSRAQLSDDAAATRGAVAAQ